MRWDTITLEPEKPRVRQLTDRIRDLIRSGQVKPGERLPSYPDMAQAMGLPPSTVNIALSPLVKEGLLERRQRHGTFVRQREAKLTCVGIYDITAVGGSLYGLAVHTALKEELHQAGIEMDVWLDPRPDSQGAAPWMLFQRAAERREFQALIGVSDPPWLHKLSVPTAVQSPVIWPNGVSFDMAQFAEIALQALAQQGCRSVGVIFPIGADSRAGAGSRLIWEDFYERFLEVVSDLGLAVRNEWMRTPRAATVTGRSQELFGYEEFLELWSQPQRPDGLLVYPDATARGVILGLREQQVRVPADLKLVLHKNEAIELLCPAPATFVVSSERAVARALIAQVQKQFRGERCEPISVPFRLMAHPTAERTRCGARPAAEPTHCGARRGSNQ